MLELFGLSQAGCSERVQKLTWLNSGHDSSSGEGENFGHFGRDSVARCGQIYGFQFEMCLRLYWLCVCVNGGNIFCKLVKYLIGLNAPLGTGFVCFGVCENVSFIAISDVN